MENARNYSWARPLILVLLAGIFAVPLIFSNAYLDTSALPRFCFSLLTLGLAMVLVVYRFPRLPVVMILLSALLPVVLVFSALVNHHLPLLWKDLFATVHHLVFAWLICQVCYVLTAEKLIGKICIFITATGALITIIGLLQALNIHWFDIPVVTASSSTLTSRPFTTEYIVNVIPFTALLWYKARRARILLTFILALLVLYLIVLRGRTGYVVLIVGWAVFLGMWIRYYYERSKMKSLLGYGSLITVGLVVIIWIGAMNWPNVSRQHFTYTVYSTLTPLLPEVTKESGVARRLEFWKSSFEMFRHHPVAGVGTGAWSGYLPAYLGEKFNDANIYDSPVNPHNDYLEYLSESGIIAFSVFIGLIGLTLFFLWYAGRKNLVYLCLLIAFIGLLIASFFSFTKDRTAPVILFYLLVGIGIYLASESGQLKTITLRTRLFQYLAVIFLLLNAGYNYWRLHSETRYVKAMHEKFNGNYEEMNQYLATINGHIYPVDPNEMPPDYYAGVGHFDQGDFGKASVYFSRALELNPYSPTIRLNIAVTHYALGHTNSAIDQLQEIIDQFPHYMEARVNLLSVYANAGKHQQARALIRDMERMGEAYEQHAEGKHWSNNRSFQSFISGSQLFRDLKKYYDQPISNE